MDSYQNPYMSLPGISPEEIAILQQATVGLNESQLKHFFNLYSGKRKSPQDMLIFCIIGIVIPGIQRFIIGQIAWAILYFFTGGLFFVMTIMDLINHKKLALEFNTQMAYESFHLVKMSN